MQTYILGRLYSWGLPGQKSYSFGLQFILKYCMKEIVRKNDANNILLQFVMKTPMQFTKINPIPKVP